MATAKTLRCPCCNTELSGPTVNMLKNSLNAKLAKLTNPPVDLHYFRHQMEQTLSEVGLGHWMERFPNHIKNLEPQTHRVYIPEWECYLVLQWCYYKMEVAYFS